MKNFKIGVLADGFRLAPLDGIRKAAELGAAGVQIYTVNGPMAPQSLTAGKRAELRQLVSDLGIAISALCGDVGGGFRDAAKNPPKVAMSKQIVDLAADLGTRVVTTHIGVTPEDRRDPAYRNMLAACREMADYAAAKSVTFAVETGPEKAVVLKQFLDEVGSQGLGVNFDPANLVMVVGDDPAKAAVTLGKYIVHTHAKDGIQIRPGSALAVYHGAHAASEPPAEFKEVPLGEGQVNWPAYLRALDSIGYRGFLTIEREVGADPAADIAKAIAFLRQQLNDR
ncbi:MAG: sugar phosphate isomerase/epimerase [Kiritimatiellae bacterium]|nr:sugar phosphate isomerase/epimerase [Kiritimatiellia bacterium]